MEKNDLPEAFGVFKPVGHIVIAFRSAADQQAAAQRLLQQGFAASALVRFTPDEMKNQVDADMKAASVLASIGQELNLVKAHRALAESGCSFLVVHAPDDDLAERVAVVARTMKAVAAQRYGRFIIEELVEQAPGEAQVFESPGRGLDIETRDAARR
jgi:hypothetical protein